MAQFADALFGVISVEIETRGPSSMDLLWAKRTACHILDVNNM